MPTNQVCFELPSDIPAPKFRLLQQVSYSITVDGEGTFTDIGTILGVSWDMHDREWLYDINFSPDFSLLTDLGICESVIESIATPLAFDRELVLV